MSESTQTLEQFANRDYEWGFVTDIEADSAPPGLNEEIIRFISAKKDEPEFMLEWRLKAYRRWLTMEDPTRGKESQRWAMVHYPDINYQDIVYYSAPKQKQLDSLDEVDPEILATYQKLGIPLEEQKMLAGVAVDAVFDSVSVATTFKDKLAELGIVFCSMSEAIHNHPELVQKYLGSVVPYTDNFFATLNSAVFTDGSFVYVPPGVRCPMELSTYFRINAANTGQFERTLVIARRGVVCVIFRRVHSPNARRKPAPRSRRRTRSPRRRADQVLHRAELVSRRRKRQRRDLQLRHQARRMSRRPLQDLVDSSRDRLGHHLEVP